MKDSKPTQYYDSKIPGKAWAMSVFRTSRGQIKAWAIHGNIERRADGSVQSFGYTLFQAKEIDFVTGAKRLTQKAYNDGIAMLLPKVQAADAELEEETA